MLATVAAAGMLSAAPAAAQPACGPVETTVDLGHQHLIGDAQPPGDYPTVPPTSGWHYPQPERIRPGVHSPEDPLSEAEQVSVLAVGGVVVTYRDLPEVEVTELEHLVAHHDAVMALTPYDRLEPGEVALTAWALVQRCAGYDPAAVAAFVDEHAAAEPDMGMGGEAQDTHEHPDDHDHATEPVDEPLTLVVPGLFGAALFAVVAAALYALRELGST